MYISIKEKNNDYIVNVYDEAKKMVESLILKPNEMIKDNKSYDDAKQIFYFIKENIWETSLKYKERNDLGEILDTKLKSFLTCG